MRILTGMTMHYAVEKPICFLSIAVVSDAVAIQKGATG